MENGIAITASNISKTFHISEDSHNTVKHRLFNLFNPPRRKNVLALKKDFIDTKVKFFSSGMMARLAFSIAVNAGADIMFLDEIFSVDDMKFQDKAIKVFESSWIQGKT